jgi:hypothetical protein
MGTTHGWSRQTTRVKEPHGISGARRLGPGWNLTDHQDWSYEMQTELSTHRRNEGLIGGSVLIIIWAALLAGQMVPDLGRFIVLAIGLVLLATFVLRREYGWLVAGSIVSGVGVGVVLSTTLAGTLSGAAVLLSIGGGFIAIWLISYLLAIPERHWWPLIPGLIMLSIGGALALGEWAVDLLVYWPLALIVIGVLLLGSALLRQRSPA